MSRPVLLLDQMIGVAKRDKSSYLVKPLHAGKSSVILGKNEFGQQLPKNIPLFHLISQRLLCLLKLR